MSLECNEKEIKAVHLDNVESADADRLVYSESEQKKIIR